MPLKINIGDSWKDVKAVKINIGDTWKDVKSMKINIGDTWKDVVIVSGWDISNASYSGKSFYIRNEVSYLEESGLYFKPDGTKMWIVDNDLAEMFQYSLMTPWDISTASYDNVSKSFSSQDNDSTDVFFKPDGTKMYMAGKRNDRIYQYSLSTPWDITTASYDNVSFYIGDVESGVFSLYFKSDGTKMYIIGDTNDRIYQYSLTTAWDISTLNYDGKKSTSPDTFGRGCFLKPDGTKAWICGDYNNKIYQYNLSTPWDISTYSFDTDFSVDSQDTSPRDLFFSEDGTKMYVLGRNTRTIYQYSL